MGGSIKPGVQRDKRKPQEKCDIFVQAREAGDRFYERIVLAVARVRGLIYDWNGYFILTPAWRVENRLLTSLRQCREEIRFSITDNGNNFWPRRSDRKTSS